MEGDFCHEDKIQDIIFNLKDNLKATNLREISLSGSIVKISKNPFIPYVFKLFL